MVQAVIYLSQLNYHVIRTKHLDLHEIHEPPIPMNPSASSYFDLVGAIWSQMYGGYFDRKTGEGALFVEAPPSNQGAYFDRV